MGLLAYDIELFCTFSPLWVPAFDNYFDWAPLLKELSWLLRALFKLPTLIYILLFDAFLALYVVYWFETTGKLLDYICAPLRLL